MSTSVALQKAKVRLKEPIANLTPREEVIITANQQPIAKRTATATPQRKPRLPGTLPGRVLYMMCLIDTQVAGLKLGLSMLVLAGLLLLPSSPALATTPMRATRQDIFSRNHAYVLDVNPKTQVHTVYAVTDRKKPLWSFTQQLFLIPKWFLSNDGQVVTMVAWPYVDAGHVDDLDAVSFVHAGGVFRSYKLPEVCSSPVNTMLTGMHHFLDFSECTWYWNVTRTDDIVQIETTGLYAYTFSCKNGTILDKRLMLGHLWYRPSTYGILLLILAAGLGVFVWWRRRRRLIAPGVASN